MNMNKSKYICNFCGRNLPQLCEYPKCRRIGKKRTYIIRLCDFHESKYPFLCDFHYEEVKRDMRKRFSS